MDTKEILIVLIMIAYLTRIFLIPFFIMFPYIPHDFYAYVGPGKCLAEGKFPRWDCASWYADKTEEPSIYGPLFSALMMVVYLVFGEYDILMFKLVVVIFDVINVLIIYLIGLKFFSKKKSFYIALLYCFSFIVLYNSAILGNDEVIVTTFILSSIYFLMNKKLKLSAIFWCISIMLKNIGIIIFPAMCYYVYRKIGIKKSFMYFLFNIIFFFIISLPFILIGGLNGVLYHIIGSSQGFQGGVLLNIIGSVQIFQKNVGPYTTFLSFYNIFRNITNININSIAKPVLAISYLITLIIICIKKLKNINIEFFRNMTILWIVVLGLGFQLVGFYMYFFFPYLLILLGLNYKKNIFITKQFILGIILIIVSLFIYSTIYREGLIKYSFFDRILLLSITFLIPFGVYNLFYGVKTSYRIIWSIIILAILMSVEVYAAPLLVLPLKNIGGRLIDLNKFSVINKLYGDHIKGSVDVFLAYGIFYGGSAVILWVSLGLLYYTILKDKFQNYKKEK